MKKIRLFSICLIGGLVVSQILPYQLPEEVYTSYKAIFDTLLFICLAFIMINVGREFDLNKKEWRTYVNDYFIAMVTAAAPWILVAIYFILLTTDGFNSDWNTWRDNLLLSRFAAPTSAGILFTMLAAAGLKSSWIYKKTQVLAIFDDLDTILLMIPLQIMMVGMKWQLFIIIFVIAALLYFGWVKLGHYAMRQSIFWLLLYAIVIVGICNLVYMASTHYFGESEGIHIEVLLPAFVLGMMMKTTHHYSAIDLPKIPRNRKYTHRIKQLIIKITHPSPHEELYTDIVSYIFMFLVGISTPLFIGNSLSSMGWGTIALHVIAVTVVSNIGKLFPLFFYRDRSVWERLALSIGMFTRGEVGAGIIIIALAHGISGPALIIAILSLVLNLVLTGVFILIVKRLALKAERLRSAHNKNTIRPVHF